MIKKSRKNGDTSQSKTTEFIVKEPAGLLDFLLESLSNRSRNSVKSILSRGQVSVNGQAVTKHNHQLEPGQQVSIQWGKGPEKVELTGLKILHEDDDIIVIEKESGLLTIASSKEKEMTAYRQLMAHVRSKNPKNRIFIVHRLDRDTSGVMMFAKNKNVQQLLQNSWRESILERTYVALVEGKVKKEKDTIISWLKETKTLLMYSSKKPNDGQKAVTHYKMIQSDRNFSLLEVKLETGRKNQIRVHMKDIGHPIVGDKKYGSRNNVIGRLGLHARILAFKHPITGETLRFEAKIPKQFLRPFNENKKK
ncbi:RluA family pseudouridine synthase [Scopulibacillus cellulosilyticus]|uniref:Pseudouridine synthase n=1 Tax=Scopulibacillus cellulosilyticus TaxID=2665665 RepID=A0ABW2PXM3_9BACL